MANGTGVVVGGSFVAPPVEDVEKIAALEAVKKFDDGGKLVVTGEADEHGLPVAFIVHAEPVVPVEAHPRHPGVVTRPGESRQDYVAPGAPVPHVTRVPVAQVVELVRAGVLTKPEKKAA